MDNSSPTLNKRGLKWFFRTSPHDEMFTEAMFDFFKEVGAKTGHPVEVGRAVLRGQHLRQRQQHRAAQAGDGRTSITVAADIKYRANSPSLSAEAQRLKAANADVVMPSQLHVGRDPADAQPGGARLQAAGDHGAGGRVPGAGVPDRAPGRWPRACSAARASRSTPPSRARRSRPSTPPIKAKAGKDLNDNTSRQVVGGADRWPTRSTAPARPSPTTSARR